MLLFLLLFFIYNVKFKFLFGVGTSYLVMVLFCFIMLIGRKKIYLEKPVLFLTLILVVFALISSVINHASMDVGYLKFAIVNLVGLFFVSYIRDNYLRSRPLLLFKCLGYVGIVNAVIIVLMFSSQSIQQAYLSFVRVEAMELYGSHIVDSFFSLRLVGITGFAAYATGFSQTVCLLSLLYYVKSKNNNYTLKYYLAFFVIIVSCFISARSSIIGVSIFFLMLLFDRNNVKRNFLFILFLSFFSPLLFLSVSYFLSPEKFDFFSNWVLELFNSGKDTTSLQGMLTMYDFDISTFRLLGYARLRNDLGGYFMNTDIGYIRIALSVGVIGLVYNIFYFVYMTNVFNLKRYDFVFMIALIVMVLAYLLKGTILLDAFYIIPLFYLMGECMMIHRGRKTYD